MVVQHFVVMLLGDAQCYEEADLLATNSPASDAETVVMYVSLLEDLNGVCIY